MTRVGRVAVSRRGNGVRQPLFSYVLARMQSAGR